MNLLAFGVTINTVQKGLSPCVSIAWKFLTPKPRGPLIHALEIPSLSYLS